MESEVAYVYWTFNFSDLVRDGLRRRRPATARRGASRELTGQ